VVLGGIAAEVVRRAPWLVLLVWARTMPSAPEGRVRSFVDDAARYRPLVQRPLGLRTVAVDRIVGSVGRAHELGAAFLPRHAPHGDARYQRIHAALARGEILPPVELYKLGYDYYVLDGNHRVAAARALGQPEIDAVVTEFLPVDDADAQRVFLERRAFEQATGLTRIGAARPGHYPRLEAMIRAHAESEGITDLREAARHWYERVYRPMAARLRAAQLGRLFPGERTADLVVHLADLQAAEEERLARPVSWQEALDLFLRRYRRCQRHARLRLPSLHRLLQRRPRPADAAP
jgi:hypothetical protein